MVRVNCQNGDGGDHGGGSWVGENCEPSFVNKLTFSNQSHCSEISFGHGYQPQAKSVQVRELIQKTPEFRELLGDWALTVIPLSW